MNLFNTVQLEKRASLFTTAWPSNSNRLWISPLTRVLARQHGPFRWGHFLIMRPDDSSPLNCITHLTTESVLRKKKNIFPDYKIFCSECVCCYYWPLQAPCCQLCKYFDQEYLKITHWNQIYFSTWDEKKAWNTTVGIDEALHGVVIMLLQSC